jgi:ATP-binding cassette subfamily A (ABC1) protein 3
LAIILAIGALLSPSSAGVQIILTLVFPPMFYTFFTKALAAYENIPLTPDYIRTSPQGDAPVIALLVVAIVRQLAPQLAVS